jgi:hypothetical protein
MEKLLPEIIAFVIGAGIVGLFKLAPGGIRGALERLVKDVSEIKLMLEKLVSKEMCKAHREKIEGDINNLGDMIREKAD